MQFISEIVYSSYQRNYTATLQTVVCFYQNYSANDCKLNCHVFTFNFFSCLQILHRQNIHFEFFFVSNVTHFIVAITFYPPNETDCFYYYIISLKNCQYYKNVMNNVTQFCVNVSLILFFKNILFKFRLVKKSIQKLCSIQFLT